MRVRIVDLIESEQSDKPDLKGDITCKFLLVQSPDEAVLIYGTVSNYPYHAQLVERFCADEKIPSGWIKKPDLIEIYDTSIEIAGGGWMKINKDKKRLRFSGESSAYGNFKQSLLRDIINAGDDFTNWQIKID
jgi:hypothetical protein